MQFIGLKILENSLSGQLLKVDDNEVWTRPSNRLMILMLIDSGPIIMHLPADLLGNRKNWGKP